MLKSHLLVEKPITLQITDSALKLNKSKKRKGVNLWLVIYLLFHPAFNKMKEIIDSGKLG